MESPVRAILAGCGGMSRVWLRYLTARADVELVGLVDPVPGRAAERAREFELSAPCFTDIESALAGCDADLVCDTSVPDAHAGNAAAALPAGCDVFTEKPMPRRWRKRAGRPPSPVGTAAVTRSCRTGATSGTSARSAT